MTIDFEAVDKLIAMMTKEDDILDVLDEYCIRKQNELSMQWLTEHAEKAASNSDYVEEYPMPPSYDRNHFYKQLALHLILREKHGT